MKTKKVLLSGMENLGPILAVVLIALFLSTIPSSGATESVSPTGTSKGYGDDCGLDPINCACDGSLARKPSPNLITNPSFELP